MRAWSVLRQLLAATLCALLVAPAYPSASTLPRSSSTPNHTYDAEMLPETRVWGSNEKILLHFSATLLLSEKQHWGYAKCRWKNVVGSVVTYDYDAFGNLIHSTGTTLNNYLFAGEQFDPDLGLYFNRARYLNTNTGRFWSMDTLEGYSSDSSSLHKYLYCFGNAVNCLDPSGNDGDTASAAAYEGGMVTIDTTPLVNFLKVLGVVGALAGGYVAAPYIFNALDKYQARLAAFGTTVTTALALYQYHFQRWTTDPDFQRSGNHYVDVGLPSGPTTTPEVTLDTITVPIPATSSRLILTIYEGGPGGRIFGVQYRIGLNATLGRGYFGFRADYLDFRSNPPVFSPHYHLVYSFGGEDQNEDHVPL